MHSLSSFPEVFRITFSRESTHFILIHDGALLSAVPLIELSGISIRVEKLSCIDVLKLNLLSSHPVFVAVSTNNFPIVTSITYTIVRANNSGRIMSPSPFSPNPLTS
jgi:hypothetical protein